MSIACFKMLLENGANANNVDQKVRLCPCGQVLIATALQAKSPQFGSVAYLRSCLSVAYVCSIAFWIFANIVIVPHKLTSLTMLNIGNTCCASG